jgi:hypothetical protein
MAFNDKVAEIKTALQALIGSLDVADNRIERFAKDLGAGVQGAASFKELSDAVNKFASSVKQIDSQKFTELGNAAKGLQQTLNALSATGPNKVTDALQQQVRVMREIEKLQFTLQGSGQQNFSPAQEIFKARQQAALELINQRVPNADPDKARRLASELAEGIQEERARLGQGQRIRTPALAAQLEQATSKITVPSPRGIDFGATLADYKQQVEAQQLGVHLPQIIAAEEAQAKASQTIAQREQDRLRGITGLNEINDEIASAKRKEADAVRQAAAAEAEAVRIANQEKQARQAQIAELKRQKLEPFTNQANALTPTARNLLTSNRPGFLQGKEELLDERDIAKFERQARIFEQFQKEVSLKSRGKESLVAEGFNTQSYLDLNSGITKVVGQGQLLDGTFLNLNGRINQNGKLVADLGTRYNGVFDTIGKNIAKVAEFAIATTVVYGAIQRLGEAFRNVVSVQDELTQISFTIKEMGANADEFSKRFLTTSIQAGIETGQGFEESIQTQLSAFRLTAGSGDLKERERITNELTKLQLGSQTGFGLTQDQSIDSVGTIYRQIVDQGATAGQAVSNLTTLFDKFTVAMQNSGVKGNELVQTFAQLVGVSKDLNISQNDLVALTAAFSQSTNKSPQETANALKILGERVYGEGANNLNDIGIATREIDPTTGRQRNRELIKVLQDAYVKSLESETASLQVAQAIGGQRRAPEAAALVRTFPIYQDLAQNLEPVGSAGGPSGQFKDLVEELNKNLIPTLNRLSNVFSSTVAKILLDGGLLEDITRIINILAKTLGSLNDIDDPRIFKVIKEGITALVLGLGFLGVSSLNIVRNLSNSFLRLGETIRGAVQAQKEFQASSINAQGGVGVLPYGPVPAKPGQTNTEVRPFVKPETLAKVRNALTGIGAVAIPVAFELTSEEANLEKYTGVGARIAGGLVGFMVGGPGGAIVGQEIGKAISDYLDVAGVFGTSENEKNKFITGGASLDSNEYSSLQSIPRDRIEQLRAVLEANSTDAFDTIGGVFANRVTAQGEQKGSEYLRPQLQFLGVDTNALQKLAKENPGATIDELIVFLQELNVAGSKARRGIEEARKLNPVAEYPDEMARINQRTGGTTSLSDQSSVILESADRAAERIEKAANTSIENIKSRYETPYNQAQFGAGGLQEQGLQSQFLSGKITGEQYNTGIDSLRGLPEILGQALPLFDQMGLSTEGLVQKLYEAGPAGQQSFQQVIAPLIEAYSITQEYAILQQELIQLQQLRATLDPDSAEARSLQEKIVLHEQELALIQAKAQASQQYIDRVGPTAGSFLQGFFPAQQKAITVGGTKGTPAQFQAPALFDASDYSIEQISKALEETKEKQAALVKLFPEYAKEFAKQQFVLDNGAGGYKPVGGINQSFFSGFLQDQKKQARPDLIDLSEYSDQKIGDILKRAAQLQSSAIQLAPDLAPEAEASRLLILKKNNDLLAQNGLSQEFLRIAMDELTKSNEDILRGHYNLPADYRAPTVFDYYDNGGREKGDVNYPRPGGDANLDLAQKIANAIISSQGQVAGQAGPDLNALGNTIQPGSAPIGYPNPGTPGTPGRTITPPSLPLPLEFYTTTIAEQNKPGFIPGTGRDSAELPAASKDAAVRVNAFGQAADRNEKRFTAMEARLDGFASAATKSSDALTTLTSIYGGTKTAISKFSEGFNSLVGQFAPKELSPLIRASFLQGLQNISPGAIVLNVVLNGQAIPASQAKVTIGTAGTGGQSLVGTSPTASRRGPY